MLIQFLKSVPGLKKTAKSILLSLEEIRAYFQWKKLSRQDEIKLELGSGRKKGTNGFTTVDLHGADIHRNLKNGIPLKDNSVDVIYNSHLLEHIPYPQLIFFLKECRRVLKVGGYMSVCVPDAKKYIEAYMEGRNFIEVDREYKPALVDTGSHLDQINYIAYMAGEHCYMFDEQNLVNTLKKAGFSRVETRHFDSTIDLVERDFASIYAIATN
jgi:predicted SAM-dependent methyltransferase